MNLPDGLKMMSMAEFAAYYDMEGYILEEMFEFGAKPTQTSLPGYNLPCVALTLPGERPSECTGTAKGPLPSRTLDLLDLYVPQSFINKQGLTSILIQKIQITTIEELKLAGGYSQLTRGRSSQLRDIPLLLLVIQAVDIFNALVLETLIPLKIIAPLIRRCLPGPVFFIMTRANTR